MKFFVLALSFLAFASGLVIQGQPPTKAQKARWNAKKKRKARPDPPREKVPGEHHAFVNFIRHAEDCDVGGHALSKTGQLRAQYIRKCMSKPEPSLVMPFGGAPSAIFVARVGTARKNKTIRPQITAEPLAETTGVRLQAPCYRDEATLGLGNTFGVFADCQAPLILNALQDKSTINLFMTKHEMPYLVRKWRGGFLQKHKAFREYPEGGKDCMSKTQTWKGEFCNVDDPDTKPVPCAAKKGYGCNDVIFQVEFIRSNSSAAWELVDIVKLFQEFHGKNADQTCDGDLAPITNSAQLHKMRMDRKQEHEAERLNAADDEEDEEDEENAQMRLKRETSDTGSSSAWGVEENEKGDGLDEKKCYNCPCPESKVLKVDLNPFR